jgi:hypothetical protein
MLVLHATEDVETWNMNEEGGHTGKWVGVLT